MARVEGRLSYVRVPSDDEVSPEVKELWALPQEKLGFVPNILRLFALRERHLLRWWSYYDELMRGDSGLSKAQREMIAVTVSSQNRCHYCLVSHTSVLRVLTGDPVLVEQIATDYRVADLEPQERAMLDFAVRLTTAPHGVGEDDVDGLRAAGWSDEEILDIAQVASMFNFTNRLVSAMGWRPNPEYFSLGR